MDEKNDLQKYIALIRSSAICGTVEIATNSTDSHNGVEWQEFVEPTLYLGVFAGPSAEVALALAAFFANTHPNNIQLIKLDENIRFHS